LANVNEAAAALSLGAQRDSVLTQLDGLVFPRCHLLAQDCDESSQPIQFLFL
jgi:hypothetical protein